MAWEQRKGHEYYYRGCRDDDGRVVKQYYGNGVVAEMAACKDRERLEQQRREDQEAIELGIRTRSGDEAMVVFEQHCELLLTATLLAAGFHKHGKTWRRKGCPGRPKVRKR